MADLLGFIKDTWSMVGIRIVAQTQATEDCEEPRPTLTTDTDN